MAGPARARWRAAWRRRWFRRWLGASLAALGAVLAALTRFLRFNEQRPGYEMADPLLAVLPAVNVGWPIFALTYGGLAACLALLALRPARLPPALSAYALMVAFRITTITLLPLASPPGIILLDDPLVRWSTGGLVLSRDMFFSGHTATLSLCALVAPYPAARRGFAAAAVLAAAALLLQHAHYTVDVLAAPFFAYGAWRLVRRCARRRKRKPPRR